MADQFRQRALFVLPREHDPISVKSLAQFLPHDLCAFNQRVQFVLANIALQQNQSAICRDAQLLGGYHGQQLPNLRRNLLSRFANGAFDICWQIGAVVLHHPSPGRLELAAAVARTPGWRIAYLDGGGVVLLADGLPPGEPEGMTGPTPAAATSGVSDVVEMLVDPLRPAYEQAAAYYQRGRAIHFLFGPPGYRAARADFEAALRLVPDFAPARAGLAATGSAPGGVQR